MGTRVTALHRAPVRPRLLAGGERTAVIWNFAFGFLLFMATRSVPGLIAAVVLCGAIQGVLVALAKRDPQGIEVIKRSLDYQRFFDKAQTLDAEPSEAHVQRQAGVEHLIFWFRSIFNKKGKTHVQHS